MLVLGIATAAGAALAGLNGVTTRRLWRSDAYERAQKIFQTLLVWLLPGGALIVRFMLNEPHASPTSYQSANAGARDFSDYVCMSNHSDTGGGGHH